MKKEIRCCKCNKNAFETGGYLVRVNEKGVNGIWECRPDCETKMDGEAKIIAAIDGVFD